MQRKQKAVTLYLIYLEQQSMNLTYMSERRATELDKHTCLNIHIASY